MPWPLNVLSGLPDGLGLSQELVWSKARRESHPSQEVMVRGSIYLPSPPPIIIALRRLGVGKESDFPKRRKANFRNYFLSFFSKAS